MVVDNEFKKIKGDLFVPDTSIIIEGILSKLIEQNKIKGTIIIHNAVLAELEHQANDKRSIGLVGINEIKTLKHIKKIKINYDGAMPTHNQIIYAKKGSIDYLIRDLAKLRGATLLTADKVQYEIAQAMGVPSEFILMKKDSQKLSIEKYFDETTMSIHIKDDTFVRAKKGKPGEWSFVELTKNKLKTFEVEELANEIVEKTKIDKNSFMEIDKQGVTIVQFRNYRIVITRPPLSDGWEITAVKPIRLLTLDEYNINEKLLERLKKGAEGILVAGAPGNGKSTFCQALGNYYLSQEKIIKTIEAPRDLIFSSEVTQYSKKKATHEDIHDILLLSRPDYTIFDEVRNVADFELFKDLRLSGVGMVGVVHATNPIDAVQRFVGKIELGLVPSIIDTVIYIDKGQIGKVLTVKMTVKMPSGMKEVDLARPIVEIRNALTGKLEYEMYTFGEQTVVIPVDSIELNKGSVARNLAVDIIKDKIKKELPFGIPLTVTMPTENSVEILVPSKDIASIIGKKGVNIDRLERKVGVKIQVRELPNNYKKIIDIPNENSLEKRKKNENAIDFKIIEGRRSVEIDLGKNNKKRSVDINIDNEYVTTVTASKSGTIKLGIKSEIAQRIIQAKNNGTPIEVIK